MREDEIQVLLPYTIAKFLFLDNSDETYVQFIECAICEVLNRGSQHEKQGLIQHLLTCANDKNGAAVVKKRYQTIVQILNLTHESSEADLQFELNPASLIEAINIVMYADVTIQIGELIHFQGLELDKRPSLTEVVKNRSHLDKEVLVGHIVDILNSGSQDQKKELIESFIGVVQSADYPTRVREDHFTLLHAIKKVSDEQGELRALSEYLDGEILKIHNIDAVDVFSDIQLTSWHKGDPDNASKLIKLLSNCQNQFLPPEVSARMLRLKETLNAQKMFVGVNLCEENIRCLDLSGLDLSHATLTTQFMEDDACFKAIQTNAALCGTFLYRILRSDCSRLKVMALSRLFKASQNTYLKESARNYYARLIEVLNARRLLDNIGMSAVSFG